MRRPPWWLAVVVVLVLAIFGACLANALAWIGRPFSGLLVLENGVVVSIGRSQWTHMRYRSVPFSRILAVDGHPMSGGRDVHAYVSAAAVGKPIRYTLRNGTTIFRLGLEVRPFTRTDFLELFAPMLVVGLLLVLIGAATVVRRPEMPEARALFTTCLSMGVTILTGPDAYWPYWFTSIFFLSLSCVPPAFLHLALTYPRRRATPRPPLAYLGLYVPFAFFGGAIIWSLPEPTIFLPLLYTAYLFISNAVLLHVGSLVLGLIDGVRPREPILLALGGTAAAALVGVSIVVAYPLLVAPISPAWLAVPLLLFAGFESVALQRFGTPAVPLPERLAA